MMRANVSLGIAVIERKIFAFDTCISKHKIVILPLIIYGTIAQADET